MGRVTAIDPGPDHPLSRLPFLDGPPGWVDARAAVLPLLERGRPPIPQARPVSALLDPGLQVGFGVDLGPMFLHVTETMLEGWSVSIGELTRRAIGNLRDRALEIPEGAGVAARVGVTRLVALQAPGGWASSLLLAPDLLSRWFGHGRRLFLAPTRNLLVSVPGSTDVRVALWLRDEIAAQLPDALDVPLVRFIGDRVQLVDVPAPSLGRVKASRAGPVPRWRARPQGAATTWYRPPPERSVT